MANLLPPPQQKIVLGTQRTRFLFVFAAMALGCAGIFYLALLPGFLTLRVGGVKAKSQSIVSATSTELTVLREMKTAISQINPIMRASTTPSAILQDIIEMKPAGIAITAFTYTSGKPGKIVVSGSAQSSDLIQTFRAALASDARFDSVNIPVSALVGASDGGFVMTINGSF